MIVLEGRNIDFHYFPDKLLLRQANIHVKKGECVALIGSSGCGKTTLCYILAGIIPRSIKGDLTGEVFLSGRNIVDLPLADLVRQVGIVFQDPESQLFSPTVEDEIAFGPENLCLPREEIDKRIEEALRLVGMEEHRRADTQTLSYGQKQLIAIAAVLALQPQTLILDEIFSHLDFDSAERIKRLILGQKKAGKAILLTGHGQDYIDLADRVYQIEKAEVEEIYL